MIEHIQNYGYLIVIFPLAGTLVNGLLGRAIQERFGEKIVGIIACSSVIFSFLLTIPVFISIVKRHDDQLIINNVYNWIKVGSLNIDISLLFDPLSSVMILIITGVGSLIHIYSAAYMKGDPGFYRYFAYLNLFVFSMLLLVLADNLLFMFIGWEGVGLCSYLLIGFWYGDISNAVAGNKAFIVNRVGDLGFLIGIFLLFWLLNDRVEAGGEAILSFSFLSDNVHLLDGVKLFGISAVTAICLCLFVGATGKSAQIPLYVWLPDAMAGPTPVSALIHAATMVTAGVYMIGRLNFLFSMSGTALALIAVTGAATAFLAATIGCLQNDIKKVLAYSTCIFCRHLSSYDTCILQGLPLSRSRKRYPRTPP
jgi:NADH-quinone oxidoreductase subunit L